MLCMVSSCFLSLRNNSTSVMLMVRAFYFLSSDQNTLDDKQHEN